MKNIENLEERYYNIMYELEDTYLEYIYNIFDRLLHKNKVPVLELNLITPEFSTPYICLPDDRCYMKAYEFSIVGIDKNKYIYIIVEGEHISLSNQDTNTIKQVYDRMKFLYK